jgi:hypothetical protein
MAVIAVVALELGAFGVLLRRGEGELTLGLAPTLFTCQIALLCAVLTRGWSRAFWTGFVGFGCAMMATFAWAACFTESAANDAFASYVELAEVVISAIPSPPQWLADGGDVAIAVVYSLPQLVAACAGGVFVLLAMLAMRPFFRMRALNVSDHKPRV